YISVPMQQVRSKRRAEDQISRIQASGQTNIYPALGIVYRMLQQLDAKAKHVILLSDGDTHPADFERLLSRMRAANIVVSTVTVGEGGDPQLMQNIAKWGGGRSYIAVSAESIPQIFVEETNKAVRANLVEQAVHPVLKRRAQSLAGVDFANAPALKGHVWTKPRNTAEIYLATQDGAPLLARWQYGLGKTVMFSSDVKNRWAADWIDWPGYGKLWSQLVRETMRRDSGEIVDFHARRDDHDAVISLNLLTENGRFRNDLAPLLQLTRAGAAAEQVSMRQAGPGSYEARVPLGESRTVSVKLLAFGGINAQTAARAGFRTLYTGFADEYRSLPPNLRFLESIARHTGGKLAPSIAEVFDSRGDHGNQSRTLWPWLALAALVAYLFDILLRRAPFAWRRLGS
ncbi:MAG: VWA domain-containing protein, partial [Burkholderiales bacterium]